MTSYNVPASSLDSTLAALAATRSKNRGKPVDAPPPADLDLPPLDLPPLNEQPPASGGEAASSKPTAVVRLQQIAESVLDDGQPALRLYRTPGGQPYARCWLAGHWITCLIDERGGGLRHWLIYNYQESEGTPPNNDAVARVIAGLRSRAEMHPHVEAAPTFTRIAHHAGRIYIDLANDGWQAIEVYPGGWRVINDAPVAFVRRAGMLALPPPVAGGNLVNLLQPFCNVPDEQTMRLIVAWLIGTLQPSGAHAHLMVQGEQGTAKTSLMKLLRRIVDPHEAIARLPPRDEDALMIAAQSAIVSIDNISHIADWLSDGLSVLATGGSLGKRQNYTDGAEYLMTARRPAIMTAIESVVTRGDLASRVVSVTLAPIADDQRRDEATLEAQFVAAWPYLLGALLDVASRALADYEQTKLARLPRLADFARWVAAAGSSLGWPTDQLATDLADVQTNSYSLQVEGDAVGRTLAQWASGLADGVEAGEIWQGTAATLLALLTDAYEQAEEPTDKQRGYWPADATRLSGRLTRIAPALRAAYRLDVQSLKSNGSRKIVINRLAW